ncbi:YigZ family protein [Isachenkonia alkalipeptolytica]|uniref:YigZ family protein n=1 Tax=Isachenkonia alkalipeptolytica TaxID=2565777 RepID=A0AA43XN47_9CLOT|nr:YigZ family protein [Isachenkonia alkalipeptolytica]
MIIIYKKYKKIEKEDSCEIIIQKSSFIGFGAPITSEEEAQSLIAKTKKSYPDANHHVYAYIVGKNYEIQRFSDDGEPSGTAGKPILEIMKKEELVDSLIIVTRYFGGIKLGAGGLIRAYAKSAKEVLGLSGVVTMQLYELMNLEFEYHHWGKVENEIRNQKFFKLKSVDYDEKVHCQVYIAPEDVAKAKKAFMDLTAGQGNMVRDSQEYIKEE